jgi:hypothetical protein
MKKLAWITLTGLFMIGCGSAPAPAQPTIDHSKTVASFSDQERQEVCAWQTAELGGEGKVYDCGNNNKFTIKGVDDCAKGLKAIPASCTATYGDVVDCANAQAAGLCDPKWISNPACVKEFSCVPMSM